MINDLFFGFILFSNRNNPEKLITSNDKFFNTWTGMCNQLSSIVSGIFNLKYNSKKIGIIDNFVTCVYNGTTCDISKILDLKKTTEKLNKVDEFKDIILLDRNDINISVISAEYGCKEILTTNVTSQIKKFYKKEQYEFDRNIFYDLLFWRRKRLYVKYNINDYIIDIEYEFNHKLLNKDYLISEIFKDKKYLESHFFNLQYPNMNLTNKIFESLVFQNKFYQIIDYIHGNILSKNINYNILHFSYEFNVIDYYSDKLKINSEKYKTELLNKYFDLIEKYFDKDIDIYVSTYSDIKVLTDKFPKHNFKIINNDEKNGLLEKFLDISGSQLCAIVDLLLMCSLSCNIFIGNRNYKNCRGSSFSYLISLLIKNFDKKIFLDYEDLMSEEEIYYKN